MRNELVKVRCTADEKQRIQELADREAAGDVSKLIRDRLFGAAEEKIVFPWEEDESSVALER